MLLGALLWLASLPGGAWAQSSPAPKNPGPPILVLVSRHPGDGWASSEVSGIQRALAAAVPPVSCVVEYLDWQGNSGPEYEERMAAYYAAKFARRKFRVVIAADDPAVEFFLKKRDVLFPGTQAVFCGIQRFDEARRQPWFTGILETNNAPATFDFARRLQPGLKRFVILEDSSGAGKTAQRKITEAHPELASEVSIELLRADTAQALFSGVESLPPDTAVLLTRSRLVRRVLEELRERCPVPIYGLRAPMHLPGALGGVMLDGEEHGAAAAQLAIRLLKGESPANIPFSKGVPHRMVADYHQLVRFGIPLSALPPECEVLNRPPSLWQRHGKVILAAGAVAAVLSGLAAGLFWLLQQKRSAVARLDNSLSLLSATFDSISDGVLVVDATGRVTGYNQRFLALWAIPPELAEKKDDAALLGSVLSQLKDPDAFLERVQNLYAHPEDTSTEIIEFKDGRVFERDSRPQRRGEEIVGRVWSFRDVTARRRAEEEGERLSAQLAQAQKMEALGTLAGGVAHDFNNILTGILGCSELAQSHLPESHPATEELRQVIASAERASGLVRQILTFSRKRVPEKKVVFLEPIVRETLKLLRATAPAAVELVAELPPGVPPVLADPAQMHQALLNLCTNALHAMGRGPGRLRVALAAGEPSVELRQEHSQWPSGSLVCLTVADTGHGMAAAELARVFEPFFTTKDPGVGTGLGLSVVHGIMQIHDGAVTVESDLNKGTVFRLFLPPAQAPVEESPLLESVPVGHGERILVVDDEPVVAEVAASMLRRLGYEVTTCAGAERALELFAAAPDSWALVLSDLNMPRLTGLDLIRRLRDAGNAIPCLLATGFIDSASTEAEARALGIGEILEKPFTKESLGRAIAAALAANRPAVASS